MNEMGNNDLIFDNSKNAAFLKGEKRPITKDRGGVKDPLNARNLLFMLKNTKFAGRNFRLKVGVARIDEIFQLRCIWGLTDMYGQSPSTFVVRIVLPLWLVVLVKITVYYFHKIV